ncbi:ankyrin repeat domain-containing protein [Virgisporangium aliadipatigenens]|nr:ankyrin repeat domain-containing protein [Virgisporangium aliadipatigenens]
MSLPHHLAHLAPLIAEADGQAIEYERAGVAPADVPALVAYYATLADWPARVACVQLVIDHHDPSMENMLRDILRAPYTETWFDDWTEQIQADALAHLYVEHADGRGRLYADRAHLRRTVDETLERLGLTRDAAPPPASQHVPTHARHENIEEAVEAGDLDAVRRFLDDGADPRQITGAGDPLLVLALMHHRSDVALALLAAGADPDARRTPGSQSALWWAAVNGDERVAEELLRRGAPVDDPDTHGGTPLGKAASSGRPALVRLLLAHGADPNATVSDGRGVLELSVRGGLDEILALLLAAGADPLRGTPLVSACVTGSTAMVHRLVTAGADVDAADEGGVTPLMHAASRGVPEMVEVLLDAGADPHRRDGHGRSAWDLAGGRPRGDAIRELITRRIR